MENEIYNADFIFTTEDIKHRAAKFAANKLGASADEVLASSKLTEAAIKLFWGAYIANEVEL